MGKNVASPSGQKRQHHSIVRNEAPKKAELPLEQEC